MKNLNKLTLTVVTLSLLACAKNEDKKSTDIQETAQQIGDVMASIDESSGSSSGSLISFVDQRSTEKMFARLLPQSPVNKFAAYEHISQILLPNAQAAACSVTNTFSSCSSNVVTRTFGGCSIGSATLDGTVSLTWSDSAVDTTCAIAANGHSITRVPNFTITGRRGGTLTVSKTGSIGQRITRDSAGSYTFTNDGIKRVIAYQGTTLFDFTTETVGSGLTVTGVSRGGRTLSASGGAGLKVTNNSSGVVCTYTPSNVTWSSSCSCATSGSWSSTCSDGKSSSLTITGCGTGSFSMGSESESLTFDRCYSI